MKKDKFQLLPHKSIDFSQQEETKDKDAVYLLRPTDDTCPPRSVRKGKGKNTLIASKLYEELDQVPTKLHYVLTSSDESNNKCFYDYTVHPYKE